MARFAAWVLCIHCHMTGRARRVATQTGLLDELLLLPSFTLNSPLPQTAAARHTHTAMTLTPRPPLTPQHERNYAWTQYTFSLLAALLRSGTFVVLNSTSSFFAIRTSTDSLLLLSLRNRNTPSHPGTGHTSRFRQTLSASAGGNDPLFFPCRLSSPKRWPGTTIS